MAQSSDSPHSFSSKLEAALAWSPIPVAGEIALGRYNRRRELAQVSSAPYEQSNARSSADKTTVATRAGFYLVAYAFSAKAVELYQNCFG